MTSIDVFPPELLAMIFVALKKPDPMLRVPRLVEYRAKKGMAGCEWALSEPPAWPTARLVCRRWDDIICATSLLWRDIRVPPAPCRPLDWLQLCLERTMNTTVPINVDLGFIPFTRLLKILDILRPHSRCLRTLSLCVTMAEREDVVTAHNSLPPSQVFATFLASCASGLEELRLGAGLYKILAQRIKDDHLMMPPIRALRLIAVRWPPHPGPLTRHLRTLELNSVPKSKLNNVSADPFLSLLEGCKDTLEELYMTWVMPNVAGPSERIVFLPRLKRLAIDPIVRKSVQTVPPPFWDCLRTPLSASITLNTKGNIRYIDAFPRDSSTSFPILRHATSARLYFLDNKLCIACTEPGGGTLQIAVKFEIPTHDGGNPLDTHVEDVCAVLGRAPLTALTLEIREEDSPMGKDATMGIFRAFPALETVEVVIKGKSANTELRYGRPSIDAPASR